MEETKHRRNIRSPEEIDAGETAFSRLIKILTSVTNVGLDKKW